MLPGPLVNLERRQRCVSIPFIAGQWSLLYHSMLQVVLQGLFQSPSLRGSGRFPVPSLHTVHTTISFQSPSLRGSGRFRGGKTIFRSFCGVSIPFIAGQWSLQSLRDFSRNKSDGFQSPSLRGSGRFDTHVYLSNGITCAFQSPSLRGSGRFGISVAIAFIICVVFQSPSLRGSGRFNNRERRHKKCSYRFNPLHCGAVVASRRARPRPPVHLVVSIPFIAGQWSLHELRRARRARPCTRFNPLHCGAVVASTGADETIVSPAACFNPLHCGAVVAS